MTFQTAYDSYRDFIGLGSLPQSRKRGPGRPPKRNKIVVAGDLHCPWQHKEAIVSLISEESADTDLLVINGDLMDLWSASRWRKQAQETDIQTELAESQATLCLLAEHFKKIVVLGGNHDSRPSKLLSESLPLEMMTYLRIVAPHSLNPLQFLAHGLSNVEIAEPIRSDHAEFGFLYQVGDMVCSHAETYSRIPVKAAGTVSHWINSFAIPQGVVRGPVRCVIQAHTHQAGLALGDYGAMQIEGGCLCHTESYVGSAKIMTPRPWAVGWTVVYQDGGKTDFRSSRFIPFQA
ncbi:MAG: metallophosphoesterase [Acidobacteria bacterium]|nr:metallophosphoesterase [Acidobacteriota bacterium]